ncbi:hypothetical protein CROQUDRAFT_100768 [Cronartium quercuum f. sp. fusiforme G11]|uniref:Uncharacterized protein n=1 Tax=Cronartium quercuum f. sp. fusiforme G11 TaxID=708437 RepID=A0A9P6N973_9BASI|nr:hypothetical protein CROQUDRAFT_100768 [Cronartium quercuum f. sp. fusiforme G11]
MPPPDHTSLPPFSICPQNFTITRLHQASTSANVDQSSGTKSPPTRHGYHIVEHPMIEHLQPSTVSSTLPTMVPQSLLISANPVATLRIYAEAERVKSRKQNQQSSSSWANAWTRFPTVPTTTMHFGSSSATANQIENHKRLRLATADLQPNVELKLEQSSASGFPRNPKRKRLKRFPNHSHLPFSSNRSPTPSSSSDSLTGSSEDTTSPDPYVDEDEDGMEEHLVPAYACLPPTPLTPHDILQSSTLSRLFSRNNRSFHQIANSATGLVEADLKTCNRMGELVEVLRGDLGGRKWVEVVERAFLAPTSTEMSTNSTGLTIKERSSPMLESPQRAHHERYANVSSHVRNQRLSIDGGSKAINTHTTSTSGRDLLPDRSSNLSDLHGRAQSSFSCSSDGTIPVGLTATDSLTDGRRSTLDPRYQILTQAPGFIQSLFVSSDPVTVPVLHRPTTDGRGFHAHHPTSPSDCNTSQKINGISSSFKNHLGPSSSASSATETLSVQQQIESFHECAIELSKFLGDLTDYRDRLLEIRDGCLTVEKRRLAMWAVVKLCANDYDEICHSGQDGSGSEPSSATAETDKVEPNGTSSSNATVGRANGQSPSQRGKNRAR